MSDLLSSLYALRNQQASSLAQRVLKFATRPLVSLALRRNGDPIVRVSVGDRRLWINWSHNLPAFLVRYPHYETEIGRIVQFIHRKLGSLSMIDVGANVGDTIALLPHLNHSQYLCIEGSKRYFDLLTRNFASDANVKCIHALIADSESAVGNRELMESSGTAHIETVSDSGVRGAPIETLDAIVQRHPAFQSANFLKVDTDGFDFRVLRSASNLIAQSRPTLHIELSALLWQSVGQSDFCEAFAWLAEAGYESVIAYDNHGYLLGEDLLRSPNKLLVYADYSLRRRDFYMNLIAFHSTFVGSEEFYSDEQRRFVQ